VEALFTIAWNTQYRSKWLNGSAGDDRMATEGPIQAISTTAQSELSFFAQNAERPTTARTIHPTVRDKLRHWCKRRATWGYVPPISCTHAGISRTVQQTPHVDTFLFDSTLNTTSAKRPERP
jgi:hypothetical protein